MGIDVKRRLSNLAYRIARPSHVLRLASDPVNELTRLANRYGSDKGDIHLSRHFYTRVYGPLFAPLRDRPLKICEVGLLHKRDGWKDPDARDGGGQIANRAPSLEMWSTYFPQAQIVGFDINDFSAVNIERVTTVQGDMGNPVELQRIIDAAGGDFDIVIEDASHASHHQQISLAHLFPHVRVGGLYIIEDLRYQPSTLEPSGAVKTRDLLKRGAVTGDYTSAYIDHTASDQLARTIDSIEFFDSLSLEDALSKNDSLAVIQKRAG
jgi:hypothetical protein